MRALPTPVNPLARTQASRDAWVMISTLLLDPIVDRAFAEDLSGGDLSAEACVPDGTLATARAFAKTPQVVCGGAVFRRVFERLDPTLSVSILVADGTFVEPRTEIYRVEGNARSVLMAERTALNFVQRMTGIATMARKYVEALPIGSTTRIADTRKTTPGLRPLERYAVRVGGAHNHRNDLGSAVMIKDNHIVAAGGITAAVVSARARAPHTSRIEVEVANLVELREALDAKADIVMLDNFSDELVLEALAVVSREARRPLVEASGGITFERVRRLAEIGVDIISVGALTHSAPAADISLDFAIKG